MAPALTPGRKKQLRENQFFDVGVQGRYAIFFYSSWLAIALTRIKENGHYTERK